jgi:hypothetical protein
LRQIEVDAFKKLHKPMKAHTLRHRRKHDLVAVGDYASACWGH